MLGYPEQAHARGEEALELANRLGRPFSIAFALMYAIALAHLRRDYTTIRPRAEALMEIARENGFPYWSAVASMIIGRVLVGEGNHAVGIVRMRGAMETLVEAGGELIHCYALSLLAEAHLAAREIEKGLAIVDEALRRVEASGQHLHEAEIWRLRGEFIMLQDASAEEAERSFCRAMQIARAQRARSWELRSATSLGRFLHLSGRGAEVRSILDPVIATFAEGRQNADFKDAAALIAQLDR
jgi:adenylate cyclase